MLCGFECAAERFISASTPAPAAADGPACLQLPRPFPCHLTKPPEAPTRSAAETTLACLIVLQALPARGRLVPGHCVIVPADHVASTRQVDEQVGTCHGGMSACCICVSVPRLEGCARPGGRPALLALLPLDVPSSRTAWWPSLVLQVWTELRNFKKCLIQMFMKKVNVAAGLLMALAGRSLGLWLMLALAGGRHPTRGLLLTLKALLAFKEKRGAILQRSPALRSALMSFLPPLLQLQGQEVIFFETATQLGSMRSHAAVECVPVPPSGAMREGAAS